MLNGNRNQDRYPTHYQKTDIFNISPEVKTEKRAQIDRNKSSVFGKDAAQVHTPRKDRMASDIFFGGNTTNQRFDGYEPSLSRQSSAQEVLEEERFREAEIAAAFEAAELAAYREHELAEAAARQELQDSRFAQDSVTHEQGNQKI
jgi:hypothetical protein